MTSVERVNEIIENASKDLLIIIYALLFGAYADKREEGDLEFFQRFTKGELQRAIRHFRILQNRRPDDYDDLEKAIRFIRYDVLKKGTV